MPYYDYQCDECRYCFEAWQAMKEQSLRICPQCNKDALHRVISSTGIIFKGSGFYVTDSKASAAKTTDTKNISDGKKQGSDKAGEKKEASQGAQSSTAAKKKTAGVSQK